MIPANQHSRMGRGHTLGKICSSGAINLRRRKEEEYGTLQASQHKLASLPPPTPGKSHLSKVLLEQSPCLCQSQLDAPWYFPEASDLQVKQGNYAGSPAPISQHHDGWENLFLAISGLLWASPAGDMVSPLLQSALATQHPGRAGMCCRNDLSVPGAAQGSGRTCSALAALCMGNHLRKRMPKGY